MDTDTDTHTHSLIPTPSKFFATGLLSTWWVWPYPRLAHLKQVYSFILHHPVSFRDLSHLEIIFFVSPPPNCKLHESKALYLPGPVVRSQCLAQYLAHSGQPIIVGWINELPKTILIENNITYRIIFSNQIPRSDITDSKFLSSTGLSFIVYGPWEGALGTGVYFFHHKMTGNLR